MKAFKRTVTTLLCVVAVLTVAILGYVLYMQHQYYRIPDHQRLKVGNNQAAKLTVGKNYTATTYNVGFGAYNHQFSFFMDKGELKNGTKTRGKRGTAVSKATVLNDTKGVVKVMQTQHPDFMLFQEIDTNSTRSKHVNQVRILEQSFKGYGHVFANNFHSAFLMWPLTDPHGSVQSGLLTLSRYQITTATRRKYPVTTSFISRFTDLDRCFSITTIPVNNGKSLLLINSHMSAYDKGGQMRKAQMKLLNAVIERAYQNGNYVIVGGDYNHALGKEMLTHFASQERVPDWISVLDQDMVAKHFTIIKATNQETVPTVRSTDIAYHPGVNYRTVCDGFLVSSNVRATATNLNTNFDYADHNPVKLTFTLK
jgi:hypothetical protein